MKYSRLIIVLFIVFFSSFTGEKRNTVDPQPCYTVAQSDTVTAKWIEEVKKMRDALYRNDTATVKSFFIFPVKGSDEIWYLVWSQKQLDAHALTGKNFPPFTEKDFNKYYKKIFSNSFVKALLKIKTPQLYANGEAETPEWITPQKTVVKLYASVDKTENLLILNLSIRTPGKEEAGESNIIYTFSIANNQLRFLKIQLAG